MSRVGSDSNQLEKGLLRLYASSNFFQVPHADYIEVVFYNDLNGILQESVALMSLTHEDAEGPVVCVNQNSALTPKMMVVYIVSISFDHISSHLVDYDKDKLTDG